MARFILIILFGIFLSTPQAMPQNSRDQPIVTPLCQNYMELREFMDQNSCFRESIYFSNIETSDFFDPIGGVKELSEEQIQQAGILPLTVGIATSSAASMAMADGIQSMADRRFYRILRSNFTTLDQLGFDEYLIRNALNGSPEDRVRFATQIADNMINYVTDLGPETASRIGDNVTVNHGVAQTRVRNTSGFRGRLAAAVNSDEVLKEGAEEIQEHMRFVLSQNELGNPRQRLIEKITSQLPEGGNHTLQAAREFSEKFSKNVGRAFIESLREYPRFRGVGAVAWGAAKRGGSLFKFLGRNSGRAARLGANIGGRAGKYAFSILATPVATIALTANDVSAATTWLYDRHVEGQIRSQYDENEYFEDPFRIFFFDNPASACQHIIENSDFLLPFIRNWTRIKQDFENPVNAEVMNQNGCMNGVASSVVKQTVDLEKNLSEPNSNQSISPGTKAE